MRQIRAYRGRQDDGERRADTKLHVHGFRHAENAEHLIEHRHDHRAAANAEQAGEQAGHDAAHDNGERQPEQFIQAGAEDHGNALCRRIGRLTVTH